ncbi:hypothetical protein C8F04DRAFT_1403145 [Mycena alexandri]|uniref:Uncharacterized protein n=1 Tax=Mycena alexandri TaxID=1745969 RepID=A0AAD6WRS4_9AGAR|nr:hypothetical protein C8F04DRAFT_1403145 [Mycena alexandri]
MKNRCSVAEVAAKLKAEAANAIVPLTDKNLHCPQRPAALVPTPFLTKSTAAGHNICACFGMKLPGLQKCADAVLAKAVSKDEKARVLTTLEVAHRRLSTKGLHTAHVRSAVDSHNVASQVQDECTGTHAFALFTRGNIDAVLPTFASSGDAIASCIEILKMPNIDDARNSCANADRVNCSCPPCVHLGDTTNNRPTARKCKSEGGNASKTACVQMTTTASALVGGVAPVSPAFNVVLIATTDDGEAHIRRQGYQRRTRDLKNKASIVLDNTGATGVSSKQAFCGRRVLPLCFCAFC